MKAINDLSLKSKLFIIFLILLIPLSFFSINTVLSEREKAAELGEAAKEFNETELISELLHNVQRERALSQGYFFTDGQKFSRRLQSKREDVDRSIQNLEKFYSEHKEVNNTLQLFAHLDETRIEVDALKLDSLEFESYFYNLVFKLSKMIELNNSLINDSQVKNQLLAFNNLLQAKFYLGTIRTSLVRTFPKGKPDIEDLIFVSARKSLYEASMEKFKDLSSPEIKEYFKTKAASDSSLIINNFIANYLIKQDADLSALDLEEWYVNFTNYLDQLKDLEQFSIAAIKNGISDKQRRAENRLLLYLLFVALMFVLAISLSVYIIRTLISTVNVLRAAADKVAEGETEIEISYTSKDELGVLADSFKRVVRKNAHLVKVSEAIGQGNYDIDIQIESERDSLPNALLQMKDSLKRLSLEDKKQNWILTGISELNDAVSGDRELSSVSSKIVGHICNYTHVEVGALYLMDDFGKLVLTGSFGFEEQNSPESEISPRNLAIQAIRNNKIIRLNGVKTSEFKINTSFINSSPAEVIVVPLYMQEHAVGVIELASREGFTEDKIEYLKKIVEKASVTIVTLKADIRTAQLLSETQAQAEELEVQQEELRQMNIELQGQKERLQESEEELKVNQEELEEKNADLEEKAKLLEEHFEAITSKNKELEQARQSIQIKVDELERVGKYRSDFLANMSHELRTPLNSILILAKLIAENREANLTPKQVEFAEVIHDSGNDLLKLINEILDLSKIESGKLNLEVRPFSIKEISTVTLFNQLAEDKNIAFDIIYDNDLPEKVISDRFRIEQILKNLLSNAFKFTDEGGKVTFEVFKANKTKRFKNDSLNNNDVIGFAITDTGIGISKEDQEVIFEAFRQADSSTTRKFGGTGLGLSISRQLAGLLGGELAVESEVGNGSRFTLYVPAELRAADRLEDVPQVLVKEVKKATDEIKDIIIGTKNLASPDKESVILIIEDDKGFARILADFAEGKKIKPVVCHYGKEGLEMIRKVNPTAVLLDIQLPDISGWQVLEEIKKDQSLRQIPVHIMSAYELDEIGKEGLENYLPKPITLENLDKAFSKIGSLNKSRVKKVLIIEDNIVEGNAVKELLGAHEIDSQVAINGDEAFRKLAKEEFDCIILDMKLPGMGGEDVLEGLKTNSKLNKIPVIIYSGKDFTEDEEFKLKKYVNAIVIKTDYSYKRLLDEVKLFLHKMQEKLPAFDPGKIYRADQSLKGKKVLVVDDDSRNIYSLYNAFEMEGLEIVVANNGVEALDKLDENPDVDLVLMDVMMPEMDGLECTRRIRQIEKFTNLPVITLTAKAMMDDKEKCLEAGASDYITKPVNVEKLLSLMRVWISRRENINIY